MAEFQAVKATRAGVGLLIGVYGPSNSGKTYTALRLAKGIASVSGGPIHMIDTEKKRGLFYADDFDYMHADFTAPFSSGRYLQAAREQVKAGARVLIIDSMSHEHEGSGGYLEFHAAELEKLGGNLKDTFRAWIKPAKARTDMIAGLLQLNVHIIFCFRAKEKLAVVPGQNPKELGWLPIAGEQLPYEMAVQMLLLPGSKGVPSWKPGREGEREIVKLPGQFERIFPRNEQITEAHGAALARWAMGENTDAGGRSSTVSQSSPPAPPPVRSETSADSEPDSAVGASDFPGDKKPGAATSARWKFAIDYPDANPQGSNNAAAWAKRMQEVLASESADGEWMEAFWGLNASFTKSLLSGEHADLARAVIAAAEQRNLEGGAL